MTCVAARTLFVFDNYRLPVKTGMSCGCEKQIIQCYCLLCESFSPRLCISHNEYLPCQSYPQKSFVSGIWWFLMEYLMKKEKKKKKTLKIKRFCFWIYYFAKPISHFPVSFCRVLDLVEIRWYLLITSQANFSLLILKNHLLLFDVHANTLWLFVKSIVNTLHSCLEPVLRPS